MSEEQPSLSESFLAAADIEANTPINIGAVAQCECGEKQTAMSMTPEQIAAERERFEDIAPRFGIACPKPVDGVSYTFRPVPFANASANDAWDVWLARAEIARDEQAELRSEIERLLERVRELERENRKLNGEGMDPLDYWSA